LPELLSHFFLVYWLTTLLCTAVLFWAGWRRSAWVAAALLAAFSALLLPYLPWPQATLKPAAELRLLQFNAAQQPEPVLGWLQQNAQRLDAIVLLEAGPDFAPGLEKLRVQFPHQLTRLQAGPFGIAVLSRWPLQLAQVLEPAGPDFPALAATLAVPGWPAPVRLYAVHPPPPLGAALADARNRFIAALAQTVTQNPTPALVVGDMNLTPWSPVFRQFQTLTDLHDCQLGQGWQATWPSVTADVLPLFGLPIDACLHATALRVQSRHVLDAMGSDHLPVLTVLAWDGNLTKSPDSGLPPAKMTDKISFTR
jgi:endonuclease/exonuclease/phosphatase (EEP) superfamily protein YafD